MRKTLIATALLGAISLPHAAFADEPKKEEPSYTLTGNVTLASEYLYRGIAQSNRKPAIQGGFDFVHKSGIYLGTWGSSISWLSDQSSWFPSTAGISAPMEWDFYGGYKSTAGDFGYDVGLLQYYYPGTYPSGFVSPNTLEIYVGGSWKWITLKYSYALTDLFGALNSSGTKASSSGSGYIDLSATYDVGGGFNLVGHVGHQTVKGATNADYTDWKLGATKDALGLTWGLAYIGTNAKGKAGEFYRNAFDKNLGSGRLLFTVTKTM